MPWSRALLQTEQGDYNAVIGAYIEDAPNFIFPEEEIGLSINAFFVKKGNPWHYNGPESLLDFKIGLIKDYSYGETLDNFFCSHPYIVEFIYGEDPLLMNINKLINGRFDILIDDKNVIRQKADKMGLSDQIVIREEIASNKVYVTFSPNIEKSEEYAKIFSDGIKKLRETGKLKKILLKYNLEDWK